MPPSRQRCTFARARNRTCDTHAMWIVRMSFCGRSSGSYCVRRAPCTVSETESCNGEANIKYLSQAKRNKLIDVNVYGVHGHKPDSAVFFPIRFSLAAHEIALAWAVTLACKPINDSMLFMRPLTTWPRLLFIQQIPSRFVWFSSSSSLVQCRSTK